MVDDAYKAMNRTHEQIRLHGAIGSFNEGIEVPVHGIRTRLIAWPGNGFQTESVHVLTLVPGDESPTYRYQMSEESLLCLKGAGEVFLRGQWASVQAGDLAYFPDNAPHAVRNPPANTADFVLISAISPPSFDLYEPAGFYERKRQTIDFDAAERARQGITPAHLSPANEMRFSATHPELRAWSLSVEEIRRAGALFSYYSGAAFSGLGGEMRLILWPGYGVLKTGFHSAFDAPRPGTNEHRHPVSDEVLCCFENRGLLYCDDRWLEVGANECVMAPCGVTHGAIPSDTATQPYWSVGGFAAPPQLDVYLLDEKLFKDGVFAAPPFARYPAPYQR
jgi:gentisate 1,2-dioxygenase